MARSKRVVGRVKKAIRAVGSKARRAAKLLQKAAAKRPKPKKALARMPVALEPGAPRRVPGKPAPGNKAVPAAPARKAETKRTSDAVSRGIVLADRPRPRATKLPPVGDLLNKREMEQVLTAGQGRGVVGEGSLKGRLVVKDGFPMLLVVGRDKRELTFALQGPDQEVLPAYVDHKVSVSGLIRKTTNYGGTVDVRKYSAKKPDDVATGAAVEVEEKLRYLSPGEIEQICSAGMGAGMRGFASLRGSLEMTGEEFFLVVSGAGTRHQVSFILEGKAARGLKKHVGQSVMAVGAVEKASGWGGRMRVEMFEARPSEPRMVARTNMDVVQVVGLAGDKTSVAVRVSQGLTVRLPERAGHTWAIEPTMAKRIGLREANFELTSSGSPTREFFFTPRNPGEFAVEFFLAKAFAPMHVSKSVTLGLAVSS